MPNKGSVSEYMRILGKLSNIQARLERIENAFAGFHYTLGKTGLSFKKAEKRFEARKNGYLYTAKMKHILDS